MRIRHDEEMLCKWRLKQIGLSFRSDNQRGRSAVFECECGKRIAAHVRSVKRGHKKSCGCVNQEVRRNQKQPGLKHGLHNTGTYKSWMSARARCVNPNHPAFKNYGGRGIKFCDRWNDFANFQADMGDRPPGMSIDREDSSKDYEPGNCRWADSGTQNRNKRNNRNITLNGETKCMEEWCRIVGLHASTILHRLKIGMTIEEAILTPRMRKR